MSTHFPKFSLLMRRILLIQLIAALALAIVPFVSAQEAATGLAQVRIGYFAFDPWKVDTLIDGQLAPGGGWREGAWLSNYPEQDHPYIILCCSTTPYLSLMSGTHTFAFVPTGEDPETASIGAKEVTFEEGHRYALAITGEIEDESLNLLVIDETEAFSAADRPVDFMVTYVHDAKGAPPLKIMSDNDVAAEALEYGYFATDWWPVENPSPLFSVTAAGGIEPLVSFPMFLPLNGGVSLEALVGTYPGTWGIDYSWVISSWYAGEITSLDGGTIAVGDEIAGDIPEMGSRVKYTLTLETAATLNVYAQATGKRTGELSDWMFDPLLYVYGAQGRTLFWNDDFSPTDATLNASGTFDSGLEGIELSAGDYNLEVGAANDANTGPFKLIVEEAGGD